MNKSPLIISLPRWVPRGKRLLMVNPWGSRNTCPCIGFQPCWDLVNPAYTPIHQDHCPFPYFWHPSLLTHALTHSLTHAVPQLFLRNSNSIAQVSALISGPYSSSNLFCSFQFPPELRRRAIFVFVIIKIIFAE